MSNDNRKPYVYWLQNKTTGLKYIGSRRAKGCHPDMFWKKYFTSSTLVHRLIDMYGKDDFEYKILKVFENDYEAVNCETLYLERAAEREDYLNIHKGFKQSGDEYNINKEKVKLAAKLIGKQCFENGTGIFKLTSEERLEVCSMGGYAAAEINKLRGTAIFSEEVRKRQHETLRREQKSAYYDPKLRKQISSKGGKNGYFSENYAKKHGISDEEMRRRRSERGKKGGKGNKGFRYYTDGVSTYKYTAKQQKELSFDDFLKNNPKFIKGRII